MRPLPLTQGDRLLVVTEGTIERDAAGVGIRSLIGQSAGMHAGSRAALHACVLEAAGGRLQDDATSCLSTGTADPAQDVSPSAGANTG